jgi:hypothetical protein
MIHNTKIRLITGYDICRISLVIILLVFLFPILSGAQANKEDVVYLKNGSIIRGRLLELKKDTLVKIECSDRNTYVYPYNEVLKMTIEDYKHEAFIPRTRGFYNVTLLGLMLNESDQGNALKISLNMSNGYRFNRFLNFGAYTGLNFFDNFTMLPLGIDFRGDILKTRVTPYYNCQVGKAWCINADPYQLGYYPDMKTRFFPGLNIRPALGVKMNNKRSAFLMELGFEYQELYDTYQEYNNRTVDEFRIFRRISFKFGLEF